MKYFKTKNIFIKDFTHVKGFPVPVPGSETDTDNLMEFVLNLSETIFEENKDKIKGVIILIDEFQFIKKLNKYMESFLWKFRAHIQSQKHTAYVFSGSMSLKDELIDEIAGRNGVFGGRMLTFQLVPFSKETVKNYLNEKVPDLKFSSNGFNKFYECTLGIPAYVNIFAKILPKNIELDAIEINRQFKLSIDYIGLDLRDVWYKLSFREKTIIISLLNTSKKRIEIADELNISSGSLSKYLVNLQNLALIEYDNYKYSISDKMLKTWLNTYYSKNKYYPF